MRLTSLALLLAFALPLRASAQSGPEHAPQTPSQGAAHAVETAGPGAPAETGGNKDIIMPHITDAHHMEIPWFNSHFAKEVELPRWEPIHIGRFAIDLSPTKHVVMLLVAATLCCIILISAARSHRRSHAAGGAPRG